MLHVCGNAVLVGRREHEQLSRHIAPPFNPMFKGVWHSRTILFNGAGVASVFGVAIAPEAHGKGIGAAITLMSYQLRYLVAGTLALAHVRRQRLTEADQALAAGPDRPLSSEQTVGKRTFWRGQAAPTLARKLPQPSGALIDRRGICGFYHLS